MCTEGKLKQALSFVEWLHIHGGRLDEVTRSRSTPMQVCTEGKLKQALSFVEWLHICT